MIPIGGPSFNPAKRILPKNMIRTGIPMIDVFNTLVESQKLPDLLYFRRTLQCTAFAYCVAGGSRRDRTWRYGTEI